MKKLYILLFLVTAFSTHASMDKLSVTLNNSNNKTYFQTLGDLFAEGTLPDIEKISDLAWAGRCFHDDNQNLPTNAGLIIRTRDEADVGPISLNLRKFEAFSYWDLAKSASFFDQMTMEEVFKWHSNLTSLEVTDDLNQLVLIKKNSSEKQMIKVSGNYLVQEMSKRYRLSNRVVETLVRVRCYYFISNN